MKYSFKDFEPKQYNLRRGEAQGRRLVFQPSVKKHVEEGFFDDFPADIIKEYGLKTTKKRKYVRRKGIEVVEKTAETPSAPQEKQELS